jgi:hypothetical protein
VERERIKFRSQLSLRRQIGILCGILALGVSCAPVAYISPEISLEFRVKENPSKLSTYWLAELPEISSFPVTVPRAFSDDQLCLVVNVTGPGISLSHPESNDYSCANRFPGIGVLSTVFEWGEFPKIEVGHGHRRFDLMAFPKHLFGGVCPERVEVLSSGVIQTTTYELSSSIRLLSEEGQVNLLSLNDGPIHLATLETFIAPGKNVIDFNIERFQESRFVGKNFGCQKFDVSLKPDEEGVFRTGLRSLFFDVQCPSDADAIVIEVESWKSERFVCDEVTGQVKVENIPLKNSHLEASEWGWFQPKVRVSALQGTTKISSYNFSVSYASSGHYVSVKDLQNQYELSWEEGHEDKEYRIHSFEDSFLRVHEKNLVTHEIRQLTMELAWSSETSGDSGDIEVLRWNGVNPVIEDIGDDSVFAAALFDGSVSPLADQFFPAWSHDSEIEFAREQNELSQLSWQMKNWVAGGQTDDPIYDGDRRSALYRSLDGGQKWYQVYQGPVSARFLDAVSVQSPTGSASFLMLERVLDYYGNPSIRLIVQDAMKTGF